MKAQYVSYIANINNPLIPGEIMDGLDVSGLPWRSSTADGVALQPYKYGGKEFIETHGLDEYYSYARNVYPAILRTTTLDPHAESYYSISPYAWCGNNPVNRVDLNGRDWFEYTKAGETEKSWNWHDGSTYKLSLGNDKDGNEIFATLQGFKAVVVFDGSKGEKLGKDGTITGDGAKSAMVTIYGIDGKDDIKTYNGLTVSSDPKKYSIVAEGDYDLRQEQMQTSPYGKDALTYRVRQMNGNGQLPTEGGEKNKVTGKSYLDGIFLHRTNWDGRATHSSQGCLIIDGRQWRDVGKQLGKSKDMLLRITR